MNSQIQVNVFVSMLDDFEVAVPNDRISYLKFRPPMAPLELELGLPESGVEDSKIEVPITDPDPIDSMADANIDTPDTTMVFMGEAIASFRTLLKRGYRAETRLMAEPSSTSVIKMSRSSFPTYGGYVLTTPKNGSMVTSFVDGRHYNTTCTTLMNYLGRAFLGWRGSTRWTVDAGTIHLSGLRGSDPSDGADVWNSITYALSRTNQYSLDQTVVTTASLPVTNLQQYINSVERGLDWRGMHLCNTNVNPVQTVEVPYLENKRFSYTFVDDDYSGITKGPGWELSILTPGTETFFDSSYLKFFVSAGEDFNFFFFNGLPPVYFESEYGLDTAF